MSIWKRKNPSFGFISTRFSGLDGVSLETRKWVDVIQAKGCPVCFMAGELDTEPGVSQLVPKAHFKHPDIIEINRRLFTEKTRTRETSAAVQRLKEELKAEIERFHDRFGFEILVVQNALAIPMNIPLGLAITEFIIERDIPTIAHHHDFAWERERFNSPVAADYIRAAFPPVHPRVQNVVINSLAGHQMGRFTGASWTLIPNILDFKTLPPEPDEYCRKFREDIGLEPDAFVVLQPTRVVSRKGIETAAELVKRLDYRHASLVITHEAGDEGQDYLVRIEDFARFIGVDLRVVSDRIGVERTVGPDGKRIYTLADAYLNADLVVYPSTYEGYGNAFVETIYFRRPIVINRYATFVTDIETKGFDVLAFDGYLTEEMVSDIRTLLRDPERIADMVETNYMLGWRYLSYEMLEEKLEQLLINHYGS